MSRTKSAGKSTNGTSIVESRSGVKELRGVIAGVRGWAQRGGCSEGFWKARKNWGSGAVRLFEVQIV